MHTKDMLAQALREVGLDDLAAQAATGYYHDYLSPLATPEMQLFDDLARAAQPIEGPRRSAILAIRKRAINGDFDATTEEADAWAASPEGQYAMQQLMQPKAK